MVLNQQGDRRRILYGTLDCRELPAERGEEQGAIKAMNTCTCFGS